ncbi:MAG TPA: hypothetical protein VJ824_14125 [Bacillota bacterium]|nr:hypothetical protein [Bacillota bacterium]
MNRIKVHVGVVFTQAMFCDEKGKIHYHKVLTDVDKPWVSVVEAISELKKTFPEQTFPWSHHHCDLELQINFTNIHHSTESIRGQLSCPNGGATDLNFRFDTEKEIKALTCFYEQVDMEEFIRSNGILSILAKHVEIPKQYLVEEGIAIGEYFHQELGRLYEGEWIGSLFSWEDFDQGHINTS